MILKIVICIGSDEGEVVFRGQVGRGAGGVCNIDISANCRVMAEVGGGWVGVE